MPSIPPNPIYTAIDRAVDNLRAARSRASDDGKSLENYYAKTLAPALHQQFPDLDRRECDTVALISYLGPQGFQALSSPWFNECLALVREYTGTRPQAEQDKLLVQLVLAHGCGWERCAQSGVQRWDTIWPGAIQELVEITENFVVSAVKILRSSVRDFIGPGPREQTEYASMIASIFMRRMPNPQVKYTQYQSITTWDPHRGNLYGWVQHAVQGTQGQPEQFLANTFRNSLLFPLLQEDGWLDTGPIAFKRCLACGHGTEYDTALCCPCGVPHSPAMIVYYPNELLFVPGVYLPHDFRRCTSKKHTCAWACRQHYHETNLATCPQCNDPLSERTTSLWVRKAYAAVAGIPKQHQPVLRALQREIEQ